MGDLLPWIKCRKFRWRVTHPSFFCLSPSCSTNKQIWQMAANYLQPVKSEISPWLLLNTAGGETLLVPREENWLVEAHWTPGHWVALQMATIANRAEQHNSSCSLMEPRAVLKGKQLFVRKKGLFGLCRYFCFHHQQRNTFLKLNFIFIPVTSVLIQVWSNSGAGFINTLHTKHYNTVLILVKFSASAVNDIQYMLKRHWCFHFFLAVWKALMSLSLLTSLLNYEEMYVSQVATKRFVWPSYCI